MLLRSEIALILSKSFFCELSKCDSVLFSILDNLALDLSMTVVEQFDF